MNYPPPVSFDEFLYRAPSFVPYPSLTIPSTSTTPDFAHLLPPTNSFLLPSSNSNSNSNKLSDLLPKLDSFLSGFDHETVIAASSVASTSTIGRNPRQAVKSNKRRRTEPEETPSDDSEPSLPPEPKQVAKAQPKPRKQNKSTRSTQPQTEETKRVAHLESEKRRRDLIKDMFKELVALVQAGEVESGISALGDAGEAKEEDDDDDEDEEEGKKGKKRKAKKGQGRGRRGDVWSGATKNLFLDQAIKYVEWLKEDTERLEKEVVQMEQQTGL